MLTSGLHYKRHKDKAERMRICDYVIDLFLLKPTKFHAFDAKPEYNAKLIIVHDYTIRHHAMQTRNNIVCYGITDARNKLQLFNLPNNRNSHLVHSMAFSNWLCTNSTKNMVVKIVHPGGHVELHDRPILASELITRNPRCCVAHPHVFKQPWAIVAPDTTLMPGQKFYIVPVGTIRKLQKLSLKYGPPVAAETSQSEEAVIVDGRSSGCCNFTANKNGTKAKHSCLGGDDDDSCFACLITAVNGKESRETNSEDRSSSSTAALNKTKGGESQKRRNSVDGWQPNLHKCS